MTTKRANKSKDSEWTENEKGLIYIFISVIFALLMEIIILSSKDSYEKWLMFLISVLIALSTITLWKFLNIPIITLPYGIIWIDTIIVNQLSQVIAGISNYGNTEFLILGSAFFIMIATFVSGILLLISDSKILEKYT